LPICSEIVFVHPTRKKTTGRGEGSTGLRFDALEASARGT
jgi:hypothetical protein